jgi:hypothetical protein
MFAIYRPRYSLAWCVSNFWKKERSHDLRFVASVRFVSWM